MALGSFAIASIAGMVVRIGEKFLGGLSKPVEMISNVIVFLLVVITAFSVVFSEIGVSLLTQNMWVGILFFFGIGYAAANLLLSLVGQ